MEVETKFNYLGIQISTDTEWEVKTQVTKFLRSAVCLKNTMQSNKRLETEV